MSVEFELPTYNVAEGNQVEICVVLTALHGPLVFDFSFTWETMSGMFLKKIHMFVFNPL